MLDTRQAERDLAAIKDTLRKKNDEIIRAEATKEHLEKNIKDAKDNLASLGIKDVDNPLPEIEAMEVSITKDIEELKEAIKEW